MPGVFICGTVAEHFKIGMGRAVGIVGRGEDLQALA